MMEYPFYYEVRFNAFKYNYEKKLIEGKTTLSRVFKERSPIANREEAFAEFDEFIEILNASKRLITNNRGNYIIHQPTFLAKQLKLNGYGNYFSQFGDGNRFEEHVSVYLIIQDELLLKKLEISSRIENEFLIHRVSSFDYEEQDVVDNLDMRERPLYKSFGIDISDRLKTVYHYGEDYAESGEEMDCAERIILETPHTWNTIGDYYMDSLNWSDLDDYDNKDKEQFQKIEAGTKGITYDHLFRECLNGANEITVTDPYIRNTKQKECLLEFIALIRKLNPITARKVDVLLITYYSDGYKENSEMFFEELKETLEKNDDVVRFTYKFEKEVHDRTIETDTGWKVLMGRGLDIYNNYENYLIERHLPEYRTCREFHISKTKIE